MTVYSGSCYSFKDGLAKGVILTYALLKQESGDVFYFLPFGQQNCPFYQRIPSLIQEVVGKPDSRVFVVCEKGFPKDQAVETVYLNSKVISAVQD